MLFTHGMPTSLRFAHKEHDRVLNTEEKNHNKMGAEHKTVRWQQGKCDPLSETTL